MERCFISANNTYVFRTFFMALKLVYVHHYKNNTSFVENNMYMYSAYGFLYNSKHKAKKGNIHGMIAAFSLAHFRLHHIY